MRRLIKCASFEEIMMGKTERCPGIITRWMFASALAIAGASLLRLSVLNLPASDRSRRR